MLTTVEKAGRVLDLFTVAHPEWGVSEAAFELGLPKSSLHAVFHALAAIDMLERTDTGRYRLGWSMVAHAHTLLATTGYRAHAVRAMQRLVSRYGETMQLAAWSHGRIVRVERLEAVRGVRRPADDRGIRWPPHASAVGKVLLAHRPATERDAALAAPLERLTEHTLTDPAALHDALTTVRERGVAYDHEEGRAGVCCVAAPVRGLHGGVVAAMSLCAPRPRFVRMRAEYTNAVGVAAHDATQRIRRSAEEVRAASRPDP